MAAKKFTFKTTKPTGRFASFDTAYHEIKLAGKCCGTIGVEAPHKVRLMVMKTETLTDSNTNCPWTWIKLATEGIENGKFGDLTINEIKNLKVSEPKIGNNP